MRTPTNGPLLKWMAAAVLAHLSISMVHGAAHNGAHVPLSPAANLFVYVVILAGPVAGLVLSWRAERLGSLIVALSMAGALVFGVVHHFILGSPDHVSRVQREWQSLFGTTAALLALTETLGLGFAIRAARAQRGSLD